MLTLRLTFAVALIVPLVLALTSLLPDASQVTVAAAVAAVGVSTVGATFYELLHGLNALGRWLLPNALSVGVLLILILALGGGGSLDVAALALLAAHGLFFVLGLYWTRGYLTRTRSVLDWRFFAEHLRFGLLLFLGGLLMMAILRSGEIVVATLSGNSMEIAYFSLAGLVMFTMYATSSRAASSRRSPSFARPARSTRWRAGSDIP